MMPLHRRHQPWPMRSATTWARQQFESCTSGQAGLWLHISRSPPQEVRLHWTPPSNRLHAVSPNRWKNPPKGLIVGASGSPSGGAVPQGALLVHVDVHVVAVLEDRRVAGPFRRVVVAPALVG